MLKTTDEVFTLSEYNIISNAIREVWCDTNEKINLINCIRVNVQFKNEDLNKLNKKKKVLEKLYHHMFGEFINE